MSAPLSPTRLVICDGCQTALPYDPAHAGKKARCGKCGKILVVPDHDERVTPDPLVSPEPLKAIELWCRVCDTRIVAPGVDAGKKTKCPDCGAVNAVPIPKQKEKSREPPAMHGQQYSLWKVNEAPYPEELRAAQPKLFPVHCTVCDTLMYARHEHVGSKLKCPDCGALTLVRTPPPESEKKSALVPPGTEYKMDPTKRVTSTVVPDYVERLKRDSKIAVDEVAKRRESERPPMPMFPTIIGVWSMLVRDPVPTWWVGTSVVGAVVAYFALEASEANVGAGGGLGAMYLLICMVNAIILGVLWFAALAALWCTVVAESSEGHRRMHASPSPWIFESFFEMFYIIFPAAACSILAFVAQQFLPREYALVAVGAIFLLSFPVLLLSTLNEDSPVGVFSPRIWISLLLRPAHWLLFYVQSAIIWGMGAGLSAGILYKTPEWRLFIVPIAMATALLYFRVLGRLAWWLAESLPEKEAPPSEPRYQRF